MNFDIQNPRSFDVLLYWTQEKYSMRKMINFMCYLCTYISRQILVETKKKDKISNMFLYANETIVYCFFEKIPLLPQFCESIVINYCKQNLDQYFYNSHYYWNISFRLRLLVLNRIIKFARRMGTQWNVKQNSLKDFYY